MKGLADESLFRIVHDFLIIYLPKMKKCSENTIRSYRSTISALLDYTAAVCKEPLAEVSFSQISGSVLTGFLDSIENSGASVSTRNQRLQAIRSFFAYAVMCDPALMIYRNEILKVPAKKNEKKETIDYLTEDSLKLLFAQPDPNTEKGFRDLFLLLLMYDSAARVQEVADIRIHDINDNKTPTLLLHGKGAKIRTVPLMDSTIQYFHKYMKIFHPDVNPDSKTPLFYSTRRGKQRALDTSTIRKMILKYGKQAREACPAIPENIHPHLLRHSRAMHLYQHGMELELISQWLGHAQLGTTLVYAYADTEQKRKAIEQATSKNSILKKKDAVKRFVISDDDMIRRLYGLK